jgi:hypothetical protein
MKPHKRRYAILFASLLAVCTSPGTMAQAPAADEFRVLIGEDLMAFRLDRDEVVPLPARKP